MLLHRFTCFWASLYTWFNPAWPVRSRGARRSGPNVAYVMVANHQSLLDILVLFRLFVHFKWVSKIENFRVPLHRLEHVAEPLHQAAARRRESVERMMRACEQRARRGQLDHDVPRGHALGRRAPEPFKHGAFTLAQRTRAPILPIVVEGTARRAARSAASCCRAAIAIRVRVLERSRTRASRDDSVEALTEHVRALIAAELGEPAARESA